MLYLTNMCLSDAPFVLDLKHQCYLRQFVITKIKNEYFVKRWILCLVDNFCSSGLKFPTTEMDFQFHKSVCHKQEKKPNQYTSYWHTFERNKMNLMKIIKKYN